MSGVGSEKDPLGNHTQHSTVQRNASRAIKNVGENRAAFKTHKNETDSTKQTPPPIRIKDEFNSKGLPKIETAYNDPAAKFIGGQDPLTANSNNNYSTLSPEEMAKRGDVIASLGIMDQERDADSPSFFNDQEGSSPVYGKGEGNHAGAYASNSRDIASDIYDRNVNDRIFDNLADA